jgi:hypothetical protein
MKRHFTLLVGVVHLTTLLVEVCVKKAKGQRT